MVRLFETRLSVQFELWPMDIQSVILKPQINVPLYSYTAPRIKLYIAPLFTVVYNHIIITKCLSLK